MERNLRNLFTNMKKLNNKQPLPHHQWFQEEITWNTRKFEMSENENRMHPKFMECSENSAQGEIDTWKHLY